VGFLSKKYKKSVISKIAKFFHRIIPEVKLRIKGANLLVYVSLVLIFALAALVRLFPLALYSDMLLKAFDSWFQYRATAYVAENGFLSWFTWHDISSWYPWGRDVARTAYPGLPFAAAALYLFLRFIGINVDVYTVCYFFPVLMGALASVAIYFLGKEVWNSKAGLISAFIFAIIPAYTQRTVAGFFDNETLSIFLIILISYFFIISIKRKSVIPSIGAGLCLGYFAITTGSYQYMFYLLPIFVLLLVVVKRYSPKLLASYAITAGLGILIGTIAPINSGINFIYTGSGLVSLGTIALLVLYELILRFRTTEIYTKIMANKLKIGGAIIGSIAAILVALTLTGYLFVIGDFIETHFQLSARFYSIINPLARENIFLVASVGEHATSAWGIFYYYLHIVVFLMPVGLYFVFKRLNEVDFYLILFGLTALYFAGSMIRLTLILAPIACILSGIALVQVLKSFASLVSGEPLEVSRRRRRVGKIVGKEHTVAVFGLVFLMLAATVWHDIDLTRRLSTSEMAPQITTTGPYQDWQESFVWMQNNLPDDAVILSWWDYGYWITTTTNKTTLVDNGTFNSTQIAMVGLALMSNETDALSIMRQYNVTHVLVHFGYFVSALSGDEGKWLWMVRIAQENFGEDVISEEDYYVSGEGATSKFYDTLLYKLLFYREPGNYELAQYVSNIMDQQNYPKYQSYPSSLRWRFIGQDSSWPIYKEAFISSHYLVKIYEVDYSILDTNLTITNVSIYSVDDKTTAIVTVKNTGLIPFTVNLDPAYIQINGSTLSSLGGSAYLAEGSSYLNPNDEAKIKLELDVNSTLNEPWDIQFETEDYYGYIKDEYSSIVRANNTITLTIQDAKVYSNETAFVTVQNTGDEYIHITSVLFNDTTTQIISGDTILSPGQTETYMVTVSPSVLNLNVSDVVNVTVDTWEGVNATVSAVVVEAPPGYSISIPNASVYSNETAFVTVSNTGNYSVTINYFNVSTGTVNVILTEANITALNGTTTISPGTSVQYMLTWDPTVLNVNASDVVDIYAITYEDVNANMTGITVQEATGYDFTITAFVVYENDTAYVTINNNGSSLITINAFLLNNTLAENITAVNGTGLTVSPGEIIQFQCDSTFDYIAGQTAEIQVYVYEMTNSEVATTTVQA